MVKKIDHIGIAVKNLDDTVKVYEEMLGLECSEYELIIEQKVRMGMLLVGDVNIELLESTDPEGPIAKFIERKGEGFHHIAYEVKDIEEELAALTEKGFRLIDETYRKGAHGTKIAFLHPRSMGGVLVELVEK
jgi:methylmalonyl-CoA/ethylmalonyl-CoA epimerase